MAIEFDNPLTAGTVLIRDAIQSQNFSPGSAGWRVKSDGEAEFSDLTIRSSDGTDSTVTVTNGQISIEDGAGVEVIQIDADGYRFYDNSGNLLADIRKDSTTAPLAGLYTRNFAFPTNTYGFFAGGHIVFGPVVNAEADSHGFIQYVCDPVGPQYNTAVTMSTGEIDQDLDQAARVQLVSERGQRAKVYVDGGSLIDEADLHVIGYAYAGNVPFYVQKFGTEAISSDNSFHDDTDLHIALEANSSYEVEFSVSYGTTTAAGFRTQWTFPIGTSGNKMVQGLGSGFSGTNADNASMRSGVHNLGTNIEYGNRTDSGLFCFAQERATIHTGGTAGDLTLQWGALNISADITQVSGDSWLRITKVG